MFPLYIIEFVSWKRIVKEEQHQWFQFKEEMVIDLALIYYVSCVQITRIDHIAI